MKSVQHTSQTLERESVSGGIQDPRVVVGAFHASVESKSFSGKFSRRQRARIRQGAVSLTLDVALFFPLGKVAEGSQLGGILHPLNDLQHGDEINVISVDHLIDEFDEFIDEALVLLQP